MRLEKSSVSSSYLNLLTSCFPYLRFIRYLRLEYCYARDPYKEGNQYLLTATLHKSELSGMLCDKVWSHWEYFLVTSWMTSLYWRVAKHHSSHAAPTWSGVSAWWLQIKTELPQEFVCIDYHVQILSLSTVRNLNMKLKYILQSHVEYHCTKKPLSSR